MTSIENIKPEIREQLDTEKTDILICALGKTATRDMTRTVREREANTLSLHTLNSVFRLQFIPQRNKHHKKADFFELQKQPKEIVADI